MTTTPPRAAQALLRALLPPEDAEVIGGDLEETLRTSVAPRIGARRARWWYWRQVASVLSAHLRQPAYPQELQQRKTIMPAFQQDLAYALRNLRKQPGFTATAVVMLALGIGANVAIFSLVNALLLKPLPFADPDRLMIVHMLAPDRDAPGTFGRVVWSYPKYGAFRESQRAFDSSAIFTSGSWNLTGSQSPERVAGEVVDASYFHVLGATPLHGRAFSAEETSAPGSAPLVMIGYGFWNRRFGNDPSVLGRTLGLNGIPHTVVGVLRPGFTGLTGQADIWVPVTTQSAADLGEAWNHSYAAVGRRKSGVSAEEADAHTRVIGAQVDRQFPSPGGSGLPWSATAVPLNDSRIDPLIRRSVLLLLSTVAAVLLIVCINLANLTLVRGLARQREFAIRLALGASRLRLVRQLMTESGVLAVLGTVAGLAVAYGAAWAGAALMPDLRTVLPPRGESAGLTRVGLSHLGLDGSTLLFAVLVAAATSALFGLGPAWRASGRDLAATMRTGAAGAVTSGTRRLALRNLLIVGEIALALVVLAASGLMIKSVARLQATELGFKPDSLLTVRVGLPGPQYNRETATQFLDQLVTRLAGQPGIDAVAYGSCAPLSGFCNRTTATFPDRPPVPLGRKPSVGVLWASPDYFRTIGARVARGRAFSEHDRVGQPKVVVINEAAARAFWGTEDPIGRRIAVGQGGFESGAEVVGVVADVRYGALETSVAPDVYLPLLQSMRTNGVIFVRSRVGADALVPDLRRQVQAMDPDLPLTDIKMMAERFGDATWRTRVSASLLAVFSALALLLATLGVYAVMSQGVEQRRREIGVRMALGAARADILRLILGRVVLVAVAGLALGLVLAVPAMRLLSALLYQVQPGDPVVLGTLALVLLAAAVLAGYVPARRAARVDPLNTLRAE
jgi:putative ABC transport system permease protein